MYQNLIRDELLESEKTLKSFLNNERNIQSIEDAAKLIARTFRIGGKIIACGNGGSHCDAMHFSAELMGRYRHTRSAYPAIAISDSSYLSCIGNDFNYDQVFSRYVEAMGNKGDILLGISTSGHSMNILRAIEAARYKNMQIIVLIGKEIGKMSNSSDIAIHVPSFGYADRIQEIHIKVIHILVLLIEKEMENNSS